MRNEATPDILGIRDKMSNYTEEYIYVGKIIKWGKRIGHRK